MGGEATPGLGPPDDEELLGRVSSDRALCMPEACAELLLPAPCNSIAPKNTYMAIDTDMDRQTGNTILIQSVSWVGAQKHASAKVCVSCHAYIFLPAD